MLIQETNHETLPNSFGRRTCTYHGLGAEPMPMSPEQFDALIKDEMLANAIVIKAAGIKPE